MHDHKERSERRPNVQDDARLKTTDVQELFQRRADKLRERRSCPDEGTCHVRTSSS